VTTLWVSSCDYVGSAHAIVFLSIIRGLRVDAMVQIVALESIVRNLTKVSKRDGVKNPAALTL
jgi:hypothetical protein